jgi:acyl carrier protein
MDTKLFLERLEDALRSPPGSIQASDELESLEGWDSIGALSVIAVIDEHYAMTLEGRELAACKTVADLMQLVEKGR